MISEEKNSVPTLVPDYQEQEVKEVPGNEKSVERGQTFSNKGMLYQLPVSNILFSETNTDGIIVGFNRAFVEASGYSAEELLGKSHSIIKHPDVPDIVFKDMWETISDGQPWRGPVKNRRKDKSYYWVDSTVIPVMEDGRPVGYRSVRYPITDKGDIQNLEEVLKEFRNGERDYIPASEWGNINIKESLTRSKFELYIYIAMLATLLCIVYIYFEPMEFWMAAVGGGVIIFLLKEILNKTVLLNDESDSYKFLVKLAQGKYRDRVPKGTIWTSSLEMIRANNANNIALNQENITTTSILNNLMDNMKGLVLMTDNKFIVYEYNKAATELENVDNIFLENKESELLKLDGVNFGKYLALPIKDQLKKRPMVVKDLVIINDLRYDVTITPIFIGGAVKVFLYLLYRYNK